jgi:hypothetical protein
VLSVPLVPANPGLSFVRECLFQGGRVSSEEALIGRCSSQGMARPCGTNVVCLMHIPDETSRLLLLKTAVLTLSVI